MFGNERKRKPGMRRLPGYQGYFAASHLSLLLFVNKCQYLTNWNVRYEFLV